MLQLRADEYCIEIDKANKFWCKCWLVMGVKRTYLGAESLEYIKNHLLDGFNDEPKTSSGHSHSYEVSWVLSLAEAHSSLYISINGENRTLVWQDVNGKDIDRSKIPQAKILEWRNQISSM